MPEHPSLTSLLTPCYIHSYSIAEGIWLGRTQSLYLRRNPQWGRCCATISISQEKKLQRTLFWEAEVLEHFRYCKNYHELDPTNPNRCWRNFVVQLWDDVICTKAQTKCNTSTLTPTATSPAPSPLAWPLHRGVVDEVKRYEVQMVLWSSSREVSDPVDEFWGFLEKFRSCDAA